MRTPVRFPRPVDAEDTAPVPQLTAPSHWRGTLLTLVVAAMTAVAGIVGSHFGLATHDEVKGSETRVLQRLDDMIEDNRIAHSAIWERLNQRDRQGGEFEAAKPARTRKARERDK